MKYKRSSGIILHPSSLPGPDGIGDLGSSAFEWIDFLKGCGCGLWQVLPLGPTGYGDSPYQCFSAFAGNPYLISSEPLIENGLLSQTDLSDRPNLPENKVDYGAAITWKVTLLDRAFETYCSNDANTIRPEFEDFSETHAEWINDFALFMAIKDTQSGAPWNNWPAPLRQRQPQALQQFKLDHIKDIQRHIFRQFLFFQQWNALRSYANSKGIQVIGDIPIFIAYDSADAWANPELFYFDTNGQPTLIAGVPPDYFSPTGQRWGNPLYRWKVHKDRGYAWWIERLKATFRLYDIVRLDHFRGFASYWEIPAENPTAEIGRWVPGPRLDFFNTIKNELGELPLIAEDLGEITPDVIELLDALELPGMKILQFAFGSGPENLFLPHNFTENYAAYTGSHDNDTILGWYQTAQNHELDYCQRYLQTTGEHIALDMIRSIWASVASIAITPLQDLLELGTEARMNFPGKPAGNWTWRMPKDALTLARRDYMRDLNELYGRLAE
jgi:4-alpha-glucanotransferase